MSRFSLRYLAASLTVGFASALLYFFWIEPFKILETPRLQAQDLYFPLRKILTSPPPALKSFTLVMVDEESIAKLGSAWPPKRGVHAQLIEKITPYNPKVIGMDFIFSAVGDPVEDFRLMEAMRKSGRVILASFYDEEGRYHLSRPEFVEASAGSGVANKPRDPDLKVRRARPFIQKEDGSFLEWSWEVKNLIQFLQIAPEAIPIEKNRLTLRGHAEEEIRVPLSKNGTVTINYRFTLEDMERIPLWKVLEGLVEDRLFRDKIVLVGATSKALHDFERTPLGYMPGVLMHANFLVNLLDRDFLRPIPAWGNALVLFLAVALVFGTSSSLGLLRSIVSYLGALMGVWGSGLALFLASRGLDPLSPTLALTVVFLGVTLTRYVLMFVENIRLRGEVVTDPLTGLYTRRFLEVRIDQELAKLGAADRKRKTDPFDQLSVLMVDVDHFKQINDTYGHPFGDEVLKTVGNALRESTRQDDIVVRYGGEEFCVVLAHTDKEGAKRIGEKIRKVVQGKILRYADGDVRFTVSVGLASAREDGFSDSRGLIKAADSALYQAKALGRDQVVAYPV